MIKERLDEGDLALVEVLEDPIYFAEMMRTTRDFAPLKEVWPKEEFIYRWYQRDLITDQTEHIALTGGRAVGKCQPVGSRVYTVDGYKSIYTLRQIGVFEVYCEDDEKKFVRRRARIVKDENKQTYKVTTKTGYEVVGTDNHPILTQRGYVNISELTTEDKAVVVTRLPWDTPRNMWRSPELRFLGYRFFDDRWFIENPFKCRFKAIEQDYKSLAVEAGATYLITEDGISIRRANRIKPMKNPLTYATIELGWERVLRVSNMHKFPRLVPETLRLENADNIRIFLQALVSQWAEFKPREVRLDAKYKKTAIALQEMFLQCGVEMQIVDECWLVTATETAAYTLYSEFELTGVQVTPIKPDEEHRSNNTRFDDIVRIEIEKEQTMTYALFVYDYHNYISDGIVVHNSLVLEDKQLFDLLNNDEILPETKELLFATANQAQLEPVYGRLITRMTTCPIFRDFLQNRINRTLGVLDMRFNSVQVLHRARIAGTKDNNLIGLHLPRIIVDEAQVFSNASYTQLTPCRNVWEKNTQIFLAGVSE